MMSPERLLHPGARVLVVDDEESFLRSIGRILDRSGYQCELVTSAREAIAALALEPFALVLTDVNMPGESGMWLADNILNTYPDTAVVMVTGVDDTRLAEFALSLGAYGYVIKPFEANELVINVANALRRRQLEMENRSHRDRLESLVKERTASLEEALQRLAASDRALRLSHEEAIRRLARAAEFHDPTTGIHLQRMSLYTETLARAIGLSNQECEILRMASPMHDIGKIGIPDEILRKPGKLSSEDIAVMRRHPQIGHDLLAGSDSELLRTGAVIALTHHERFDGTGYPRRIEGGEIPLVGRIVALADVFDALLNERPYKPAIPFEQSLDMVAAERGHHFDPDLADAFIGLAGELLVISRSTETEHSWLCQTVACSPAMT